MSRSNSFTRNEFLHPKISLSERMTMSDFASEDGLYIEKSRADEDFSCCFSEKHRYASFLETTTTHRKLRFFPRRNSFLPNQFLLFSSPVYHRIQVFIYAIHVFHHCVHNVDQHSFAHPIGRKKQHQIEQVHPVIPSNRMIRLFTINVYSI